MRTHRYRITVGGGLGRLTCQAFEDFNIEVNGVHTSLTADLDQGALYGVLYASSHLDSNSLSSHLYQR